ncbi:hypothetical protein [Streptomyces minutiscleroticus]|uniref:Uncharacterized protein n=1 Tax=Streptomyces minutiscleroticus TaxID=68238 RepID=A0A918NBH7_9ACTN|nr:hypothetical protein [Streptomyces minutiscleroticus]GGX60354.1 hypothetical protein GCM10010358_13640 [Streptomyces minutiscleroticus]
MTLDDDPTTRTAQADFRPVRTFDGRAPEEYEEAQESEGTEEDAFRAGFPLDRGLGLRLECELGVE